MTTRGLRQLQLRRSLGSSSWLAEIEGRTVVARPVTAVPAGLDQTRIPAACVPLLGTADQDGLCWLISEYVPGTSLRRLTTAVTLTSLQAAYVAAELLAAVAELHDRGLVHGRISPSNVLIDIHGAVRLTDWAPAVGNPVADIATDTQDVRGVVAELAGNVWRSAPHRLSAVEACLTGWLAGDTAEPRSAADQLTGALVLDLGADAAARMSKELASVARSLSDRRDIPVQPVAAPEFVPGHMRHTPRPALAALATVVVVLAALGSYLVLRPHSPAGHGGATSGHSATSGRPAAAGSPTARGHRTPPKHVLTPTSRTTGPIRAVVLTSSGTCSPGQTCQLRAEIRLPAHTNTEQVNWILRAVDRCTGTTTQLHNGVMVAEPGWSQIYTTLSVPLPNSSAVELVAATTSPAKVTSAPLLATASQGRCG